MGNPSFDSVLYEGWEDSPFYGVGFDSNYTEYPSTQGPSGYGHRGTGMSQKADQVAEFDALVQKAQRLGSGSKLNDAEKDRLDFLWDELGIPGDFRGGAFGNDNILEYIGQQGQESNALGSKRYGKDEQSRFDYLNDLRGQIQQSQQPPPGRISQPGVPQAPQKSGWQKQADQFNQFAERASGREGAQMDTTYWGYDRGLDDQSRGRLAQTEEMYRAAAEGRGPSAAQAQFQSALDQTNRNALSLANSARGGMMNRALAQSNAQRQAGLNNAASAAQSAALRAQEQQAAMQGLASTGAALRQGDLSRMADSRQFATSQAAFNDSQSARNDQMEQFYRNTAIGQQDRDYQNRLMEAQRREQKRAMDFARRQQLEAAKHGRENEATQIGLGMLQGAMGTAPQLGAAFGSIGGGKKE